MVSIPSRVASGFPVAFLGEDLVSIVQGDLRERKGGSHKINKVGQLYRIIFNYYL